MKRALRRTIARVVPPASAAGVRVLLYHAVDAPDSVDALSLRVAPERFVEQMTLLRDDGYSVVPLRSLYHAAGDNQRARVAITFDDGYRSQAWAAGILRQFGFPATFFIVPRFADGVDSPAAYWEGWGHMRWDGVAALLADGFEVGAHSTTHPDLRTCPGDQLEHEVSGARSLLADRLRTDIVSFSYPFGRHDVRVRQAVQRAGYQLACTSRYGVSRKSGACYSIPRTEVAGTDTLTDFRWKLQGKYDWLGYWQDLAPGR